MINYEGSDVCDHRRVRTVFRHLQIILLFIFILNMLASKAFELIQELDRSQNSHLPAFNEDVARQVLEEINTLFDRNIQDIYNRLDRIRGMRWQLGSVLPPEVKVNLCEPELDWFQQYSNSVTRYMRSLGEGIGLDITQDLKPPKNLFIEVRCLEDYGEFELEEGDMVVLSKDSTHYLPMSCCQQLIRQGVLQHIR